MKRASYVLVVGAFLVAVAAHGAWALTPLNDTFENTNLGVASLPNSFTYAGGADGQAASFAAANSYIHYASDYFGEEGTISLFLKADSVGPRSILDTVGAQGASSGDLALHLRPDNTLGMYMYEVNGSDWCRYRLISTTVIGSDDFTYVAISYGPQYGMKLYVNGVSEGTYLNGNYVGNRSNKNVYLGDFPWDGPSYQWALSGGVDTLRTSDIECDNNLIFGQEALPEPGSLVVLASGLFGSIVAFRRRRK